MTCTLGIAILAPMLRNVNRVMIVLVVSGCLSTSACGSTKGDAVVVRVGDHAITAATVNHWIKIESVTSRGGGHATKPLPKGVLPVPPEYVDCIAYLQSQAQGGRPTTEQARAKCAVEYNIFKETILGILINYYWDSGEGVQKGIDVSEAEITQYLKELYPHPGEFRTNLRITGETRADDRLLVKSKLLRMKLVARSEQNTHSEAERLHAVNGAIVQEAAKWTPRTSCDPGYVVSACKQYHGPQT